jgi:hypothetical protein
LLLVGRHHRTKSILGAVVEGKKMSTQVKTKVVVIFYSLYTHTWQLAQAIAEGAKEVDGVEVEMYQVPELLPDDVIGKMGYVDLPFQCQFQCQNGAFVSPQLG